MNTRFLLDEAENQDTFERFQKRRKLDDESSRDRKIAKKKHTHRPQREHDIAQQ